MPQGLASSRLRNRSLARTVKSRAAKPRGSRNTRKRPSRRSKPKGRFLLYITTRLAFGLVFAALGVLLYLDLEIRQRFNGNIQSQPAHVYARPQELSVGSRLNPQALSQILVREGYRSVKTISQPGEFTRAGNVMDIYIRPFANRGQDQLAQAVRITFKNNIVSSVVDHKSARQLTQTVLEPPLIGSLQLGAYKDRIRLQLHEIPEHLIRTLLVMEDRNFETHIGVDPKAVARALWSNLRQGKATQGGSTLTQQLVKNLFLSPERTVARKVTEAFMAIMLELRFSKAEILELYLNEIFLGQSGNRAVHGFALASEYYFGRPAQQLKLHEVALLVGMIPAPSYYNPRRHPERARTRRNRVLHTLAEVGVIDSSTAANFSALPLEIANHKTESTSDFPTYIDYLHRQLRQFYSEEVLRTSGLKLYTTLDPAIQSIAQDGLSATLKALEQRKQFDSGTLQGAVVIVDPKRGEILALVGDRVKGYSGFNRAIDAERPIGSLVKPAVYLTALEHGREYSLVSVVEDSPLTLTQKNGEVWSPKNYDLKFRGRIPMYQGLVNSYNLPTVRLGLDLGVEAVVDTLHRLGIERDIASYPSTLLGASQHTPLEMAQMYQTLANQGVMIPLRSIRSIGNHRGKPIATFPVSEQRAIDQNTAHLINYALQMVVQQGTAAGLARSFSPDLRLAGKTGTTDGYRDSWFVGYGGNLLAVVWVGRDDNLPAKLSGSSGAMRVWENILSRLDLEGIASPKNDDIVMINVDPQSGLIANNRCPKLQPLPFIKGTEPESFAPCSGLAAKMQSWFGFNRSNTDQSTTPNPETHNPETDR